MNPEKIAALIARTNALTALVAALVRVVKEVRDEFGGTDLPPLAESLDEAESAEARVQDRTRQWFLDHGQIPPGTAVSP